MRAIKLTLVKDERFPAFKRLVYSKDEVPLSDVLLDGIHPWDYGSRLDDLCHKVIEVLNQEALVIPELKEFGYCQAYSTSVEHNPYQDGNIFERLLGGIGVGIFFVGNLKYLELLEIAKNSLREDWTSERVYSIISKINHDFNAIRDFIKKKDKRITISSYQDIAKYDLSRVFTLSDFEGEDKILIDEAFPTTNFRSERFLTEITDSRGFLKLTGSISRFQMRYGNSYSEGYNQMILYNCHRKDRHIKFYPSMSNYPAIRAQAQRISEEWRMDKGRYCFGVDIERAEEMVLDGKFQISFQDLRYRNETEPSISYAQLSDSAVKRFVIGRSIGASASGETIRDILRKYGVSKTGRKEELLEKLSKLLSSVYQKYQRELDSYFKGNLFIKMDGIHAKDTTSFPVLDGLDLKNMILAMYAVKHLRGNTILDASHVNDAFDLISLAGALIKGEVSIDGTFVKVAEN
jgi:hypothetical protein